ncbi:N-acetylmannosamine-6-phosphate 2-epimerase [Nonomuraea sediminis]|uniref:N-acetylmannosamine-6-phosphate 2-epimerase n=1 Tax=Nonomuraea sediminis TaxID=2835864 RepID=UPI001BDBEEB4|nr:putative N-acetylmannosamine-6-phosphate 2-epimerase [Nonomuraea sediminis]
MGVLEAIRDGLVVSCQAPEGHPLRRTSVIALLAECAERGGAVGVRINHPDDVRAAKALVRVPVIGLTKVARPEARPLITPTLELASELVAAGADLVAVEATSSASLVKLVRAELGVPVMADVSTLDEGLRAWDFGASLVSTTLSGYTAESPCAGDEPDLELVERLASHGVRTVAEGRLRTPEHVATAFAAGAWSVVIGGAVTDPLAITQRLVAATPLGHLL